MQLSQLNGTLNDFSIGSSTNLNAVENETLEQQTNGPHNDFERFNNSSSHNQAIENNIVDKIRRAVDDAILTAMDKMIIPRIETAVRSITGSTGHGTISDIQNPDRRVFLGNAGNIPLMSASSRLDLNTNQNRNDEIRNEEDFEDGDFPALRPKYDRRAPTHHSCIFEVPPHVPRCSPMRYKRDV